MTSLRWIAVLALLTLTMSPIHAASFQVTKTADTNDGVCNNDCSLREAINAFRAQALLGGIHEINIPAGTYVLTIPGSGEDQGATGDLDISGIGNNTILDIHGAGRNLTIIDGNGIDRVLHIEAANAQIDLWDLTIQGGRLTSASGDGGGIRSQCTLTLRRVDLKNNETASTTGGGGLFSTRSATLIDGAVTGNSATAGDGGGIYSLSTLTLTDTTIDDNHASTTSGNGGGIASFSELVADGSTLSSNTAGGEGGGIFSERDLQLTNTTLSGNTASVAGSQLKAAVGDGGIGVLTHVTIAGNGEEQLVVSTDGVIDMTVANSIVRGDCSAGALQTQGGNLQSQGTSCGFTHIDDLGSVSAEDLALGVLADNGGSTRTHLPVQGSVAIDAGLAAHCPATDQRGLARPMDGDGDSVAICDVGSVEAEYDPVIFSDGFESGDTTAWTSTVF